MVYEVLLERLIVKNIRSTIVRSGHRKPLQNAIAIYPRPSGI